jgi:hypothetical protein
MENGLQDYDELEEDANQGDLYEGDAPVLPQNTRLIISLKIAGIKSLNLKENKLKKREVGN